MKNFLFKKMFHLRLAKKEIFLANSDSFSFCVMPGLPCLDVARVFWLNNGLVIVLILLLLTCPASLCSAQDLSNSTGREPGKANRAARQVTFNKDIAPVIFAHCYGCHH